MDERMLEQAHLDETLSLIEKEHEAMTEKRDQLTDEVRRLEKNSGGTYSNDLMIQSFILQRTRQTVMGLSLAKDAPYFSRVDFIPASGVKETHYIGKHGVVDSATVNSVVVDWRSPVANLYYSGQIGKAYYETPDGVVDGELTRKRMFSIDNRNIKNIMDVDLMAQDQMLVDALSAVSGDRLKEVVTTIQAEQNAIIRHPMREPLIVQGVAGSGKTTIALHRIAYLLYRHAETLLPQNLMILAPTPIFLHYISAVLPDLGVENAKQTTFTMLSMELLSKRAPKPQTGELLDALLDDPGYAQSIRTICKEKGSLEFAERLLRYMDKVEATAFPAQEVKFGPVVLQTANQLRKSFLKDLLPFPWRTRQQEIIKTLKKRAKAAAEDMKRAMHEICAQRADKLRAVLPDGPDKRERLSALYQSRDERLSEIDERYKRFLKDVKNYFPELDPYEIYADFLMEKCEQPLGDIDSIRKKRVAMEDLPPLLLIEKKLGGLPGRPTVQHIVIDEAQDFSPFMLYTLKELFQAPFTLVGDMGQGIYSYRGMDAWEEAVEAIPETCIRVLRTSYRSSVEIMDYANAIAKRHPYPGQILAEPVPRHGNAPALIACESDIQKVKHVAALVSGYKERGLHSIAVIARDVSSVSGWQKRLEDEGIDCRILDPEAEEYKGGVLVAAATAVKGLEFDAVIVLDAETYPADTTGSRLLYVCATRALHELAVLSA